MTKLQEYNEEELPELIAARVEFLADLIWEVAPRKERAKPKAIVAENAESYYERNRQQFLDDPVNDILTASKRGDWWVRASYILNYWVDIKDYLMAQGKVITYVRGKGGGIYKSDRTSDMKKDHEFKAGVLKTQSDRLTYRAILWHKATGLKLPGTVTQVLELDYGSDVS
jgi:hypothetical protein